MLPRAEGRRAGPSRRSICGAGKALHEDCGEENKPASSELHAPPHTDTVTRVTYDYQVEPLDICHRTRKQDYMPRDGAEAGQHDQRQPGHVCTISCTKASHSKQKGLVHCGHLYRVSASGVLQPVQGSHAAAASSSSNGGGGKRWW